MRRLAGVGLLVGALFLATAGALCSDPPEALHPGRQPDGILTPTGQMLAPVGRQIELAGTRPNAIALSPDGKLLVASGKASDVVLIDPAAGTITARVSLPSDAVHEPQPDASSTNILEPDKRGQLSFTGLVFAPDGRRLYLSNVNGSIKVFAVDRGEVKGLYSIALPPAGAPHRKEEIPAGLAVSPDGKLLYVCGNLSNKLLEIEAASGKVVRTWDVGVAPYDVVLNGTTAYVSNWGGRRPGEGDLTGPAGRGTRVRVDPVRDIASEGSVSVIDLAANQVKAEILTQLRASALALSPDKRWLVCANAGSDNLSVIDTRSDKVVETIWAKSSPADLFGAQPCALCFQPDGRRLYVANGTQNAVAVIAFDPPNESKLLGLAPVGWFPGALAYDAARRQLCVGNLKGLPEQPLHSGERTGFNSHQYTGSVTLLPVPSDDELPQLSTTVYRALGQERIPAAQLPPRPNQPPRPVPERIGEPSVLKHVVYVIKENRTYDQVLGDVKEGNGDPSLVTFGAEVTPNQHKFVHDFVLLDNTYCCGILSADGHQWTDTGIGNDYLERSFAGWPRSYPDGMEEADTDALAYASSGFIWDNAIAHGVSLWDFGEFACPVLRWKDPARPGVPRWKDCYNQFVNGGDEVVIGSTPSVRSLEPYLSLDSIGWSMEVPDVWRARKVIDKLAEWERQGTMPQLVLICLPEDHTAGTNPAFPTPAAQVADNDLAFGQIVEALSHSKFWPETVVFGIEDDPQAGWDHVSGYRTTAYCVSPYTKRRTTVSTMYNTVSILRTIEQILGLPPMNQLDAAAVPMFDCFTAQPDLTPYTAVPNQIPLDQMNPSPKSIADAQLRRDAMVSARLNFREVDKAPEDVLNRILWRAVKGTGVAYPGWAVGRVEDD